MHAVGHYRTAALLCGLTFFPFSNWPSLLPFKAAPMPSGQSRDAPAILNQPTARLH